MKTPTLTAGNLVRDGARGRIFVRKGRGTGLTLMSEASHPVSTRKTGELGADRPGRAHDLVGGVRHAMVPPVDRHRFEKEKFAKGVAAIVNAGARDGKFDRLVVAAPPKVLRDLRAALDSRVAESIAGELPKDLTNVPEHDRGPNLAGLLTLLRPPRARGREIPSRRRRFPPIPCGSPAA